MNRHRKNSLLENYCTQLGTLLERRFTERALITSRDQAEKAAVLARDAMRQAQAADRAKSQFLATMTHELRTPLNAIIGFSEVLQSAKQPTEVPVFANYIHDSGTQLLAMLNGVLDFARIEAGRVELDEQEVSLEEVLNVAVRPLRKAADEKSIAIMSGMMVDRILVIDASKVAQVFSNVLSNAIRFTPEGGSVDIDSDVDAAGGVSVWFRDTGPGIPPDELDRVLQPFAQVEDHLTRQNGGLGLGLPIARALARMHGGELSLTSELDVGTTIEIRLPPERVHPPVPAKAA